jgi:YidC/Oxa1 family membrane protein insertase
MIALLATLPWFDVGVVVVIFTLIIKFLLFPLSKKAIHTQLVMKGVQKEIDEIKKNSKGNKQEEAVKIMALYKENKINPFSGFILVLIQLPIIISLYYVFFKGGLPNLDFNSLYSFTPIPTDIKMTFLGLINISKSNIIVAIFAAVSQFFQIRFTLPKVEPKKEGEKSDFKDELSRSMNMQMKYVLPVFVLVGAWTLPAVVGIYWITSNAFAIAQEIYMRRNRKETEIIHKK